MTYWTGLAIIRQAAQELGLPAPATIQATTDVGANQLLALLNAAGNELITYYTWENLKLQWEFTTDANESYALPTDWGYFTDQTQWDRTNHWPMLGPKSPQEWAWLKGGLLASAPRIRYRVMANRFFIWPVPSPGYDLAMEYMSNCYALDPSTLPDPTPVQMISTDAQTAQLDPWLCVKFLKLKFAQLKGFDTTAYISDFTRLFDSLTGKDVGAPILSLTPFVPNIYIGPWSIPDGSWNVGSP